MFDLLLEEFSTVCCDPHIKGFSIVNKAEIDVFLEFSCFFYDPVDAGNLISGSFVFLNQPKHLEVLGSCSVEAWLEEF